VEYYHGWDIDFLIDLMETSESPDLEEWGWLDDLLLYGVCKEAERENGD
jgi:hypothetical protein